MTKLTIALGGKYFAEAGNIQYLLRVEFAFAGALSQSVDCVRCRQGRFDVRPIVTS